MPCDDDHPTGASTTSTSSREPDCRFRTIKRYFEGPVIARCASCENLVAIEEVGDQEVTMPCGVTWLLNLRSILQGGS